jgi:hypothetical protein
MTTRTAAPPRPRDRVSIQTEPEAIRRAVLRILRSESDRSLDDCEDVQSLLRRPLRAACFMVPVAYDGAQYSLLERADRRIMAVSRDLSLEGMGFVHDQPIGGRHAIASFGLFLPEFITLLIDVRWTRQTSARRYFSGGQILGVADGPAD